MTKIKLCGLTRNCDIEAANLLFPDYVGFVFAPESRRFITPEKAAELKARLCGKIKAVGVFVNEEPVKIAHLLNSNIIDLAQLHADEDEKYLKTLRSLMDKPIIKAFRIESEKDVSRAEESSADYILLDSGAGTGRTFDWNIIKDIRRPYFLAGGLDKKRAVSAVRDLAPYGVDVSSGIETGGVKDKSKMAEFILAVRKEDEK